MNGDALVLQRDVTVFVAGRPVFAKRGDSLPAGASPGEVRRLIGRDALNQADTWNHIATTRPGRGRDRARRHR